MLVPVSTPPTSTFTDQDHRDIVTAIKLLSGQDCIRDASQAQRILVGLTESKHEDVAADAGAIMKAGLKNGWFEHSVPKYYDLQLLAETSIANYKRNPARQKLQLLLVLGGLAFLLTGLVAFFIAQGSAEPSIIMMTVAGLTLVMLLALIWLKWSKSSR